jgi:hypothetical protein
MKLIILFILLSVVTAGVEPGTYETIYSYAKT